MPKGYHHLTKFEKCQIEVLMNRGDLPKDIAETINVHVTTVKREIKRNSGSIGYRYIQAHKKSLERRKNASHNRSKITESVLPIKNFVKTLTSDNGKEFSRHEHVSKELESGFYFAKPYHSWERGLNEHTNGLIRQYFPKGMKFKGITNNELQKVEDLLNKRPRNVLEFKTPIEVFDHLSKKSYICALQT